MLLARPSFILTSTSYSVVPSLPSYHKLLVPHHRLANSSPMGTDTLGEDSALSTGRPSVLATFYMRVDTASKQAGQRGAAPMGLHEAGPQLRFW